MLAASVVAQLIGCAAPLPPERPISVEPSGGGALGEGKPRAITRPARDPAPLIWTADVSRLEEPAALLFVRADWEPRSIRIERELWTAPELRAALRGWVTVSLDATEPSSQTEHLMARLGIERVPTVVVFREGVEVGRLEGSVDVEALRGLVER